MRLALLVGGWLVAGLFVTAPAMAHAPGSEVVTATGSVLLAPAGSADARYDAHLSAFGLPIGAGDTLRFSWSANRGAGPSVYFDIHAHVPDGIATFYRVTAVQREGSWPVPESEPYMVLWENHHETEVNVTYSFQLAAPPPDLWPLAVLGAVVIGSIGVWVIAQWIKRRRD